MPFYHISDIFVQKNLHQDKPKQFLNFKSKRFLHREFVFGYGFGRCGIHGTNSDSESPSQVPTQSELVP
jgi:hypothetical protein